MRVVATLTTRKEYHSGLRDTLNSLTSQFDDVYLGLGDDYPPFEHPKVKVVKVEDIGPATKLLAGMIAEKDMNSLLVSVDDDHTYNQGLRKLFEEERKMDIEKGKDRVLTQAGVYIKYWNFGVYGMNGVGHDRDYTFDLAKNPKLTTLAGVCGVGYPRSIFKNVSEYINFVKRYDGDKILFRNDDVLISAYLSSIGVEIVRVSKGMKDFGVENKIGGEKISPSLTEIFEGCKKVKNEFKNNNFKYHSIVGFDLAILILLFLALLIVIRYKIW